MSWHSYSMQHLTNQGIVLNARPHGDGGAVVSVLTEQYGRVGGFVNGAQSSKRLRSVLQSGNLVHLEWQAKAEGQLGRFDIESEHDYATRLMNDQKALLAVQSVCALIAMFLPEREPYPSLFSGTNSLFSLMDNDNWPPAYIMWELAFLKELGYGIDLSKCVVTGQTDNLTYVSPKSGRAVSDEAAAPYKDKMLPIPDFLQGKALADDDIYNGLRLTGYFLIHRLLQHSSYTSLPDPRIALENIVKPTNI